MVVAEGLLVVLVVVLIAEVGAIMVVLLVELVVGIPGIGFELCGAEYLVPKRTLYCSANSELDCDSDYYCTNLMSSGGTDATSCWTSGYKIDIELLLTAWLLKRCGRNIFQLISCFKLERIKRFKYLWDNIRPNCIMLKSPKQPECLILWVGWTRSRPRPKYPDIFLYPFGNPACNMCRWFKSIPLGSVYDSVLVSFFPSLCGEKYDMGVRMEIAFDRKWYAAWKIRKLSVC